MPGRAPSASELFRRLNGLICIYKPSEYNIQRCLRIVRHKLTADLNAVSEQQQLLPSGTAHLSAGLRALASPTSTQYLSSPGGAASCDSDGGDLTTTGCASGGLWQVPAPDELPARLVTGAAFLPADIRLEALYSLGWRSSGPVVVGINRGIRLLKELGRAGPQLRVYHLTVELGWATDNLWSSGRTTDRATYGHVTRGRLESVLSTMQAAHQKHMFESSGLPPNSQAAYELASRGPPRPEKGSPPVLYAIRCVQFSPPFFTLEIHSINETEQYLLTLANDLGRQLRSAATAVRARCLRVGPFTAADALLIKHWRLAWLGPSMETCRRATEHLAVSGTLQSMGESATAVRGSSGFGERSDSVAQARTDGRGPNASPG